MLSLDEFVSRNRVDESVDCWSSRLTTATASATAGSARATLHGCHDRIDVEFLARHLLEGFFLTLGQNPHDGSFHLVANFVRIITHFLHALTHIFHAFGAFFLRHVAKTTATSTAAGTTWSLSTAAAAIVIGIWLSLSLLTLLTTTTTTAASTATA
jgi:hypothetical protein